MTENKALTLPGGHYCGKHRGNTSSYSEENCELCKLKAKVTELKREEERLEARHVKVLKAGDAIGRIVCETYNDRNGPWPASVFAAYEEWDAARALLPHTQEGDAPPLIIVIIANKAARLGFDTSIEQTADEWTVHFIGEPYPRAEHDLATFIREQKPYLTYSFMPTMWAKVSKANLATTQED